MLRSRCRPACHGGLLLVSETNLPLCGPLSNGSQRSPSTLSLQDARSLLSWAPGGKSPNRQTVRFNDPVAKHAQIMTPPRSTSGARMWSDLASRSPLCSDGSPVSTENIKSFPSVLLRDSMRAALGPAVLCSVMHAPEVRTFVLRVAPNLLRRGRTPKRSA